MDAVVPEVGDGCPIAAVVVMCGEPRVGEPRAVCHDVNRARPILAAVTPSGGGELPQAATRRLDGCPPQGVGERRSEKHRLPRDWLDCCNSYCERTGKSGDRH